MMKNRGTFLRLPPALIEMGHSQTYFLGYSLSNCCSENTAEWIAYLYGKLCKTSSSFFRKKKYLSQQRQIAWQRTQLQEISIQKMYLLVQFSDNPRSIFFLNVDEETINVSKIKGRWKKGVCTAIKRINAESLYHTCHKLWTKISEIRQNFMGYLTNFCKIFLNITLELP